ncbi:DUF1580 domain-containing protein [Thalassoglobus sp.]|uniref:DUF1580 domain-containing protein n=1 Tax=Thalassoglobus sp. TaxID=2795869 RepID=UPI003AA9AE7B
MINLKTETILTFREAAEHIPGSPHLSTLHRWVKYGLKGIRLESCLVGGRRVTSLEAVGRFSEAITQKVDHRTSTTMDDASASLKEVGAELDRLGF